MTEYEALIEELEVLRDVVISERELAEAKGVSHEQMVEELRAVVGSRTDG